MHFAGGSLSVSRTRIFEKNGKRKFFAMVVFFVIRGYGVFSVNYRLIFIELKIGKNDEGSQ